LERVRNLPAYSDIKLYDCNGREYGTRPGVKEMNRVYGLKHTYIHFEDSSLMDENGCSKDADKNFNRAVNALTERDCQKAAFFLGAVIHIIGDIVQYSHLLRYSDFDSWIDPSKINGHGHSFGTKINYLTCKNEQYARTYNEFFSLNQAYQDFGKLGNHYLTGNAYFLTSELGRYVFDKGLKDLFWTYENHKYDYFPKDNSDLYSWNRDSWSNFNTDQQEYFELIEDLMNEGVLYCAAAINSVASHYIDCDCNKDKEREEEQELKPSNPTGQTTLQKYFTLLAMGMTALPFILLSQFVKGKFKY